MRDVLVCVVAVDVVDSGGSGGLDGVREVNVLVCLVAVDVIDSSGSGLSPIKAWVLYKRFVGTLQVQRRQYELVISCTSTIH